MDRSPSSSLVHGIDPGRVRGAVFDLGGVFLAGGPDAVASFGLRHGLDAAAWDAIRADVFGNDGLWSAVECGRCTLDAFARDLRQRIVAAGGTVDLDASRDFMSTAEIGEVARLRPEIVDAARRIRGRMPTALLTNNIVEWRDGWRQAIDVDGLFDVVVDSSDVGMRKPDRRIYEVTQHRLGIAHEALFFVDDIGQNLKAARALGWQTLRYDDTARVLEVLHALAQGPSVRDGAGR